MGGVELSKIGFIELVSSNCCLSVISFGTIVLVTVFKSAIPNVDMLAVDP